ncbi:MAG: Cys-rich peptide radical SAM maturase CcpM [Spirochaetales bacterium]|nr:Cys-rich peptide radical SAM maturase CcpM [Spirochaetales bacterium]
MDKIKPFIHLFRTPGGYYLYDVNKNAILKLEPEVYAFLNGNSNGKNEIKEKIKKLKEKGFLSVKRADIIEHPSHEILEDLLKHNLSMVTLQVTQQCNLRCDYCAYSGGYFNREHNNRRMPVDIARRGIDFLLEHSRDKEIVSVGFYGGEPLLEFDLIKECIHYTEKRGEGKNIVFNITTNGTLLDREKIAYMAEHDVYIMVSLDGPQFMHDRHRKYAHGNRGSFEKVMSNLRLIQEIYPAYTDKIKLSLVLDPQANFSCVNDFFISYDLVKDLDLFPTIINNRYSKTTHTPSDEYMVETRYELFKIYLSRLNRLADRYTSKIINEYMNKLGTDLYRNRKITSCITEKVHHSGPCIPGVQRFFIDTNGRFFPCERVSEESGVMVIGSIDSGFNTDKIRQLLNIGKLTEESCKNCWAFRFCDQCAANADDLTQLSAQMKAGFCIRSRFSAEERFKDYCTLKELGYDFANR